MKKNILLLIIAVLTIEVGRTQTNVSGGIYSNTTWTVANNPYIVTDTVVVFPNVTLTIQPGVTIKFENNKILEVREAKIVANGTSLDSILFITNAVAPNPGIWSGIYLNNCTTPSEFNYCVFQHADKGLHLYYATGGAIVKNSTFYNNIIGIKEFGWYGYTFIDSCNFAYNTVGLSNIAKTIVNNCKISNNLTGIEGYTGTTSLRNTIMNSIIESNSIDGLTILFGDTVVNCIIRYNGTGIRTETDGYFYGFHSTIAYNILEYNNTGIWMGSYTDTIYCNKICDNTSYNLHYGATSGNNTNISNNYWCTSDSSFIASTVYDGYDNLSLSLAQFMPIDMQQCYLLTGIENETMSYNPLSIYPNPFNQFATIQFSNAQNEKHTLTVYNSLGQMQYTIDNITTVQVKIEKKNLTDGLFLFRLRTDKKLIGSGRFIIE